MIVVGFFILNPTLESYRAVLYKDIHIYFFILGALFFYLLLFQSKVIPGFISVWGMIATILLLVITILKLFGLGSPILDVFLAPMILNEIFLAFWLIAKGFTIER